MSQALLDRETVVLTDNMTAAPVALFQHEHLTLVDWNASTVTPIAPTEAITPVRRTWFGPYEICIALLMLGSAFAGIACLFRLG